MNPKFENMLTPKSRPSSTPNNPGKCLSNWNNNLE